MSQLLLGLRADPTHTEATLVSTEGKVWGRVRIPNAQANSSRQLLERAFQEASIDLPGPIPPLLSVMALPGLRSEGLRRSAAETVRSILPPGSQALICDELEPVMANAFLGRPGVLLWSDLEAAVAHLDADGVFTRHSENPDPLGQEGSGLWLGTRMLQLTARLLEGRLPESQRLSQALTSHFGQISVHQVWDEVMASPPDPITLTQLSLRTIDLAEHPNPEPSCRALVVRAARRLGELLDRVSLNPEQPCQAIGTGRAAIGSLLQEVQAQNSQFHWTPTHPESELEGCLLLARSLQDSDLGQGETAVEVASPKHWIALREIAAEFAQEQLQTARPTSSP